MTQDQYRHLSWNIYKWIRKNDPDLSSQINRELYSISEKVVVEYHMRMSIDDKTSYEEIKTSLEKLAEVEIMCEKNTFELNTKTITEYLKQKL